MAKDTTTLRRASEAGFTLVELMVALVIIALGILPIAIVQTNSTADVVGTGQQTRALSIAQDHMEVARSAGFGVAVTDSGQTATFAWKTTVTNLSTTLQQVDVNVTWTEQGAPRSLRISDLISSR